MLSILLLRNAIAALLLSTCALNAGAGSLNSIVSVTYSGDGAYIAGADSTSNVYVWRSQSGALLDHFGPAKAAGFTPLAMGFSHDNQQLFVATQTDLEGFDLKTGETTKVASLQAMAAVFNANKNLLATANDTSLSVIDAVTGNHKFDLPTDAGDLLFTLAFSPDGRYLAAGNRAFEMALGGGMKTGNASRIVKIIDVRSGRVIAQLKGSGTWYSGVAFSTDSKFVAAASYEHESNGPINEESDPVLTVWKLATGATVAEIPLDGNGWNFNALMFLPDDNHVIGTAASSSQGNVYTAKVDNGCVINQLELNRSIWSAALSPRAERVVVGGMFGEIQTFSIPPSLPSDTAGCKPEHAGALQMVQHYQN
ncbi:Predicted ATPase (AAA+ superfamily) [Burkholderia pseudomallei]|uniref:WD40 repeat domain-containing protein n=1 Tax=Burkholderia pseudomallei TaxID=28450 RepID=UPI000F1655C4|nr:hypothetical protein [Burkholderia pseudomallei]VBE31275.1 Predicted ATPase (AAA+ superfamily) [Burkholderia pseudomallei]